MEHPWRRLRDEHPDYSVRWEHLPAGILGMTDHRTFEIVLDRRQLQGQRRVTLHHELIHIAEGHGGHCNAKLERRIERRVAHDLIPFARFLEVAKWARTLREFSDELWVDDALVVTRWESLHPAEKALIDRAVRCRDGNCQTCPGDCRPC